MFEDTERNRGRYADIVRIEFEDKTVEELRTIKELCAVRHSTINLLHPPLRIGS